jgi:hypothetical protein
MVLREISIVQVPRARALTIILCDLIPRRLILVEVMLPVKPADRLDLTVESDSGT